MCVERRQRQRLPIARFEFLTFTAANIREPHPQSADGILSNAKLIQVKSYENLCMQPHPFWKIRFQKREMQKIFDCLQLTIKMILTSNVQDTFFLHNLQLLGLLKWHGDIDPQYMFMCWLYQILQQSYDGIMISLHVLFSHISTRIRLLIFLLIFLMKNI